MIDSQQRMINAQAERISKLNSDVRELQRKLDLADSRWQAEIDRIRPAHDYYMKIQQLCRENDAIMSAWQSFVATVMLVEEEADQKLSRYSRPETVYDPEFSKEVGAKYHEREGRKKKTTLSPERLP